MDASPAIEDEKHWDEEISVLIMSHFLRLILKSNVISCFPAERFLFEHARGRKEKLRPFFFPPNTGQNFWFHEWRQWKDVLQVTKWSRFGYRKREIREISAFNQLEEVSICIFYINEDSCETKIILTTVTRITTYLTSSPSKMSIIETDRSTNAHVCTRPSFELRNQSAHTCYVNHHIYALHYQEVQQYHKNA